MSGCQPVQGVFAQVEKCTEITIALPTGLTLGNYQIEVTNPSTKQCRATATFSIGPAPNIASVTPVELCEGRPGNFVIKGSGFTASTEVTFDNLKPDNVQFVSATELHVAFSKLPPGRYDVTVANGSSCSTTKKDVVTVYKNPIAFFVDPEVEYNAISVNSTIYLSGLNGPNLVFVGIRPSGGAATYTSLNFTFDVNRPNIAQATIPKGLTPGKYELLIRDGKTCEFVLPDAINITNTVDMALSSVTPPFGWTQSQTPVTLNADNPPPTGKKSFQNGVRVYFNPSGGSGLATSLTAVAYVNPGSTTAVVPKLPVGEYDVIAVNPDGSVGVLTKGFKVTTNPPPTIDAISPGSIANKDTPNVRIDGGGFATTGTLQARLTCRAPSGATSTHTPTIASRTTSQVNITISSAATLLEGSVCIIRITNPDGTYADYSALGVTGPSLNISAFKAGKDMVTARRAPATTSGRPTRAARFLYAIGGDSGTTSGALDSMETVSVDRFGAMNTWRTLPTKLPEKLTFAGVQRIGRFLYLTGGNNGSNTSNKMYRAKILDPGFAPQINDVSLSVETTGVGVGLWYYRVSAVMGNTDRDNPNGETLPGDPQPIKIPAILQQKVHIKLTWNAVPGAVRYRIYRSPTPGLVSGKETLLATVSAPTTTFTDKNTQTPQSDIPRVLGDLGEWRQIGNMTTPREGHGLGIAKDPTTANVWYLYAVLGRSGSTNHRSYEYLRVSVDSQGVHTVGNWTADATNLVPTGRWQVAAFSVDRVASTRVGASDTYIYAGPGIGALSAVQVGKVQAGGKLSSWQTVSTATPGYAGYGYAAAADQLFIFGGQASAPDTSSKSTEICGTGSKCKKSAVPPEIRGWNAGISLRTARYLMGTAIESAHIYIIGGNNASGPMKTTESTVW
tara:strand:- start:482 stop:3187 length:2706 start_codon:yes stop_codon:yes gene_type:complete